MLQSSLNAFNRQREIKKIYFSVTRLLRGLWAREYSGFCIISLFADAAMLLACSTNFSFSMISLPDYLQLRQCRKSPNNNFILTLCNKICYQISMSEVNKDAVTYITKLEMLCKNFQFTMIINFYASLLRGGVQKFLFYYDNCIFCIFSQRWGAKMFILL